MYALSPKRVRGGCKKIGLSRHILKSDVSKAKKSEHDAGYFIERWMNFLELSQVACRFSPYFFFHRKNYLSQHQLFGIHFQGGC